MVRFWNSLVVRFGLLFTFLVISCVLISGYLVFDQAAAMILNHSKERIQNDAQLVQRSFYRLLDEVSYDIAVWTNNPTVENYINDPSLYHAEQTEKLASVILKNKPAYFQLRILEAGTGEEIIRFDKKYGMIIKTPTDALQNKGNTEYYLNAVSSPEEYYFSEINLNEEYGKISMPLTPTLRAVGKIYDGQNMVRALLVINVDLTSFYHGLEQMIRSDSRLIITDSKGEYFFGEQKNKCFASQLGHEASFPNDYQIDWHAFVAQQHAVGSIKGTDGKDYVVQMDELIYSESQHQLYLFTMMELDSLMADAESVRNSSLKTVFVVGVIALFLVFFFIWILSRGINQITRAVSDLDHHTESKVDLPIGRKDEVGLLARSFSNMRQRIDHQVTELKTALFSEQRAIKERDEFLQNMSHELRTPLNAILGLTQLLNKNKRTAEQQPIIDSLYRSTINLTGLMHDILDQQKLMEGRVKLKLIPSNLYDLLYDIYASYQYEAVNKGLTFDFGVAQELKHKTLLMDPLRFNQIVINLVVNAIKYTKIGTVTLSAELREDHLIVDVHDTGEGIEEENLQYIKERFYRAVDERGVKIDGFGLGLSIVKQLIELFGGKLTVTSELKQGSKFSVILPVTEVSHDSLKSRGVEQTHYPKLLGQYRVLHVEDDPSALLLVKSTLQLPFVSLIQVSSIEAAVNINQELKPHLILTDLMLGSEPMSASQRTEWIDEADAPVIVLSAFDADVSHAESANYLQKPFDLNQLLDLVMVKLGSQEFDLPYMNGIYAQYDHRPDKIANYLKIMISEFNTYIQRIEEVKISQEEKEWKAILHKLITHINAMKLEKLAESLPNGVHDLDESQLTTIINQLRFYLCFFRNELRINSID
ncbi:ATP-binding protein [Reichenbachiella agarivorans]|uniref:histidine kinase n=1 Tax=Reichenbachiella agarivorans TaxID=2979464 RepID=A0ABY6CL88_9BACT|nr:ATP-binding protein [Reichenbachiella agarivorans]UXP31159.1 ATP-binding protein [Reichenbachiella agarivorans]